MALYALITWAILLPGIHAFDPSIVLNKLNQNVDPCNNFYDYACGNYPKVVGPLPDGVDEIDFLYEINQKVKEQIHEMLEIECYPADNRVYRLVRKLYRGCKKIDSQRKLGLQPMKDMLAKYGGWPVVEGNSWNNNTFDWFKVVLELDQDLRILPLISYSVDDDQYNGSRRLVKLEVPEFQLEDTDAYLNSSDTEKIEAYRTLLYKSALLLGAPEALAKPDTDAIIDLEIKLAIAANKSISESEEVKESDLLTLEQVKARFPGYPIEKAPENGWTFDSQQLFNITAAIYLDEIALVLANTEPRTLANFLLARAVLKTLKYLAPNYQQDYREFRKKVFGETVQKPLWEECVEVVQDAMEWPLSYIYIKTYFEESNLIDPVKKMISFLKEETYQRLDNYSWMDQETRDIARLKLENMAELIGYPDEVFSKEYVLRDYDEISTDEDKYFESVLSSWRSFYYKSRRLLTETRERVFWFDAPVTASLYYFNYNFLSYTTAALQEPLYVNGAPNYVNYGRLGSDIATSIIAAYDEYGRFFDEKGEKSDWFTNQTHEEYDKRLKCLLNQYTSSADEETKLKLTPKSAWFSMYATEDNGAVPLAYQAYKQWEKNVTTEVPPEALKSFSVDQLFFISYAQKLCQVLRPEYRVSLIEEGREPPSNFRVNIPLKNSADFSKAFNCAAGSPMNPQEKCELF